MRSDSNSVRRPSLWRRFRVSRVGVALALVAFLVLGGTGAFAYWTTTTKSMTTAASAGQLTITGAWTKTIAATFSNNHFTQTPAETSEYTVTNTSSVPASSTQKDVAMPYTVAFSAPTGSPSQLATNLDVTVWLSTVTNPCSKVTPPTSPGHWGGSPLPAAAGTLKAGTSDIWCIRTGVTERSKLGSTTGTVSISPSLVATLSLPGTNWSAVSTAATDTQSTQYVYPLYGSLGAGSMQVVNKNGKCLNVDGSFTTAGTNVIQYTCQGRPNQQWMAGASGANYVTFQPQNATSRTLEVAGAASGAGAKIQTPVSGNKDQQFQVQQQNTGYAQIVQNTSGMCLTANDSSNNTQLVQKPCDGTDGQRFSFRGSPNVSAAMTCQNLGASLFNAGYNRYTFPATPVAGYTISLLDSTYSKPIPSGATFMDIDSADVSSNTTYTVLVTDNNGYLVYTGALRTATVFFIFPTMNCS